MRRAVVHDPEDAVSLTDQAIGGGDAALSLAAAEQLGAVDVPSRQIGPCAFPEIFVFDPHGSSWRRRESRLLGASSLYAGLFVGRDYEVIVLQGNSFPYTFIQIQNAFGFVGEIRIAGEDPVVVLPGAEGIGVQPTPDRSAADPWDDALRHDFLLDICTGESGERESQAMRKLTGNGFDVGGDVGGEIGQDARSEVVPPDRANVPRQIVCAIY